MVSPEVGWDCTFQKLAVKVLNESVFYILTVNLLQKVAVERKFLVRVVYLVCGGYQIHVELPLIGLVLEFQVRELGITICLEYIFMALYLC